MLVLQRANDGRNLLIRGENGQLQEVEVVSTRDRSVIRRGPKSSVDYIVLCLIHGRDGFFERACPVLYLCPAILCGTLNLVPGMHALGQDLG